VKTLRQIFGREHETVVPNWRQNDLELVRFVRTQTPADAFFLSRFSVGPLVLAYADRPIALQPKFEVRGCQERVREYLNAVFENEEKFYALCRRWSVGYFIYDARIMLDNSSDADRWIADRMAVAPHAAVYLMHFFPEKLEHFELVYQNNFYRLFHVLNVGERPAKRAFAYQPIYDVGQYDGQDGTRAFDDSYTRGVVRRVEQAKRLLQIANSILVRDPVQAARLMERSRELYPSLIGSATTLGIAYILQNRIDDGLALCQEEVDVNPLLPLGRYNLAYAYVVIEDLAAAREQLHEALRADPDYAAAKRLLQEINGIEESH
jgi:tetratricopeptide (TPR) repeat protein